MARWKLTERQQAEIINALGNGETAHSLSKKYRTSQATITELKEKNIGQIEEIKKAIHTKVREINQERLVKMAQRLAGVAENCLEALAKAVKTTKKTVISWEKGKTLPSLTQLFHIAEVTGQDVEFFIGSATVKIK